METIRPYIQQLHDTPHKTVLAVSGAGTQAVAWLLGVSGASRTVLEALVPYGRLAMQDFLGFEPSQSASADTARQMARRAYQRAQAQREDHSPVVGLACAAAIATDRYRRGDHRAFVAAYGDTSIATWSLTFHKGLRDRAGEEEAVSRLIILALSEFSGLHIVPSKSSPPAGGPSSVGRGGGRAGWEPFLALTGGDSLEVERFDFGTRDGRPQPLDELLAGVVRWVVRRPDGGMEVEGDVPLVLLPGSFNPLHLGHQQLIAAAATATGQPGAFELSVTNVDKPPLEKSEIERRLSQFGPDDTVVLTRAETFQKKAALFPRRAFIQGWDTTIRLLAPRYYGGESEMMLALAQMMAAGARFLVAGRLSFDSNGRGPAFRTLADVDIPAGFAPMFSEIPEAQFRRDISSTELRQESGWSYGDGRK